jgi:hypothetical protein
VCAYSARGAREGRTGSARDGHAAAGLTAQASKSSILAEAWREAGNRSGFPFESPDIAARAVTGMALQLALESRHGKKFDRERAIALLSEGTVTGFFPPIEPTRRSRR